MLNVVKCEGKVQCSAFLRTRKSNGIWDPTENDQKTELWLKYKHRLAYWRKRFVATCGDMSFYTRIAKEYDQCQPFIQGDILDALILSNNCTASFRALS